MDLTDQEVRELVREAIARHLRQDVERPPDSFRDHPSHGRFQMASGGDGDGACLIEPLVRCNHCGYCVSYGH
jgi:hypothetical protein